VHEISWNLTWVWGQTYLRRDAFDTREEDFYQALYTQSQSQFNTYVTAGTLVNNYAHIFDLLTRLRQAVDHPYLVVYSATAAAAAREKPLSYNAAAEEEACGICHDPAEDSVRTGCCHTFCRLCIQEYITAAGEPAPQCPTCQKPLTVDFTGTKSAEAKEKNAKDLGYKRTSILSRIDLDQFQTSTKIDALVSPP
jgi:DNA repair protein RAD16